MSLTPLNGVSLLKRLLTLVNYRSDTIQKISHALSEHVCCHSEADCQACHHCMYKLCHSCKAEAHTPPESVRPISLATRKRAATVLMRSQLWTVPRIPAHENPLFSCCFQDFLYVFGFRLLDYHGLGVGYFRSLFYLEFFEIFFNMQIKISSNLERFWPLFVQTFSLSPALSLLLLVLTFLVCRNMW